MADIILAPICSKCHHIFEEVKWTDRIVYDAKADLYSKETQHNPTHCPKCGDPLENIMGKEFPPTENTFSFKL